nr:MAG TPA: hypothetical protein [Caudoviricetes sp.]
MRRPARDYPCNSVFPAAGAGGAAEDQQIIFQAVRALSGRLFFLSASRSGAALSVCPANVAGLFSCYALQGSQRLFKRFLFRQYKLTLNIVPGSKWGRMGVTQCRTAFYAACGALSARRCPYSCAGYIRVPPQLFARPVAFCSPLCSARCYSVKAPPHRPHRLRSDFPSGFCVRAENPRKAPSS